MDRETLMDLLQEYLKIPVTAIKNGEVLIAPPD